MSKLPTVGRAAYWASYRELVKTGWADWRKVWFGTQGTFLVAFAVHYLWLKKHVDALANLEVHIIYVVLPSLLGLLGLFVLNLFVASWRMAQDIQISRDDTINALRAEVSGLKLEVSRLTAKQPIQTRIEDLIAECDKYRDREDVHPYDATDIASSVATLCADFLDEACLKEIQDSPKSTCKYPPDGYTIAPNRFITRVQHQLRNALKQLNERPPAGPSDEERLEAAKSLLKQASADFYKDLANPTYEQAKMYIGWAHKLMLALFVDTHHADEFLIRKHDYKDKRLRLTPAEECARLAEALGDYPNWIQLSSGDPQKRHFLRDDFVPKPGRSWKDY